jgi:hypothetical protein
MKKHRNEPFCLVVEGSYATINEARHALIDPFIEEWTERTGRFRVHQMGSIAVVPGVMLGHLSIEQTDENVFMITSTDAQHPLTQRKAVALAEALRQQDMFENIRPEPLLAD